MSNLKPKPIVLLQHLLDGGTFIYHDREYGLSEDNDLLVKCIKISNKVEEEIWLSTEVTLAYFIRMANKFSDDDILLLGANMALQKEIQRNSKKRLEYQTELRFTSLSVISEDQVVDDSCRILSVG